MPVISVLVVFLVVTLQSPIQVKGHGRLLQPPSRASMWRLGYDTPKNYMDNQLFCGGFTHQWEVHGGKCGVCGDPWEGPRDHEAGGKYATGLVPVHFAEGATFEAVVELTAAHWGWFEFRLCPTNNPKTAAIQECLDKYLLERAEGKGTRYPVLNHKPIRHSVKLVLPPGLHCTQCVLQWKYHAGNSWGTDEDGNGCIGCGPQEEFYGCADIAVGDPSLAIPDESLARREDQDKKMKPEARSGSDGPGYYFDYVSYYEDYRDAAIRNGIERLLYGKSEGRSDGGHLLSTDVLEDGLSLDSDVAETNVTQATPGGSTEGTTQEAPPERFPNATGASSKSVRLISNERNITVESNVDAEENRELPLDDDFKWLSSDLEEHSYGGSFLYDYEEPPVAVHPDSGYGRRYEDGAHAPTYENPVYYDSGEFYEDDLQEYYVEGQQKLNDETKEPSTRDGPEHAQTHLDVQVLSGRAREKTHYPEGRFARILQLYKKLLSQLVSIPAIMKRYRLKKIRQQQQLERPHYQLQLAQRDSSTQSSTTTSTTTTATTTMTTTTTTTEATTSLSSTTFAPKVWSAVKVPSYLMTFGKEKVKKSSSVKNSARLLQSLLSGSKMEK